MQGPWWVNSGNSLEGSPIHWLSMSPGLKGHGPASSVTRPWRQENLLWMYQTPLLLAGCCNLNPARHGKQVMF